MFSLSAGRSLGLPVGAVSAVTVGSGYSASGLNGSPSTTTSDNPRLSGGASAGIAIGVIAIVAIITALVYFVVMRSRKNPLQSKPPEPSSAMIPVTSSATCSADNLPGAASRERGLSIAPPSIDAGNAASIGLWSNPMGIPPRVPAPQVQSEVPCENPPEEGASADIPMSVNVNPLRKASVGGASDGTVTPLFTLAIKTPVAKSKHDSDAGDDSIHTPNPLHRASRGGSIIDARSDDGSATPGN